MTEAVLLTCLIQLVIIIAFACAMGRLAVRLGQPAVIGEIAAGLMLGPSLLGNTALWGQHAARAFHTLFPPEAVAPLGMIGQLALMLLMFQTGAELDCGHFATGADRRRLIVISTVSVCVPFAVGMLAGRLSAATLAPGVSAPLYALFVGTAFAITALPILARLMEGFGLTRTRLGTLVLAASAGNDLAGWMLLSVCTVLASAGMASSGLGSGMVGRRVLAQSACVLLLSAALALLSRWPGRRIMGRGLPPGRPMPPETLCIALVLMLAAGICTSAVGLRAIFGAAAAGVACGRHRGFAEAWHKQVAPISRVLFLPVFFVQTGLHVDLRDAFAPGILAWCALFIAAAALSKLLPVFLAGRHYGLDRDSAAVLALSMNTRGLMELIVLDTGRNLGVIPPAAFTVLVVTALATTLPTAPAIRRLIGAPRSAPSLILLAE